MGTKSTNEHRANSVTSHSYSLSLFKTESFNEGCLHIVLNLLCTSEYTTSLMFHLITCFVPTNSVYDKCKALVSCHSFFNIISSAYSNELYVCLRNVKWPHSCNRFNYCMRCSDWMLNGQLIHKLNKKYFARERKTMYAIDIQAKTLSAICSISNEPLYLYTWILESNLHVRPFSDCAPPQWALTCTIIQGGMDSNSPFMKVSQAFSIWGDFSRKMRKPNRAAAGKKWIRVKWRPCYQGVRC